MMPARAARFGLNNTFHTWRLPAIPRQFHSTAVHANSEEIDRLNRRKTPHNQHGTCNLIDNAPGWNEDLATSSEASVKADRQGMTMGQMEEKTVNCAQSRHDAKRDNAEIESTRASYARDEVDGPLGSAGVGVGEFEGVVGHDDLGLDERDIDPNGRVVTRRVIQEKATVRESES